MLTAPTQVEAQHPPLRVLDPALAPTVWIGIDYAGFAPGVYLRLAEVLAHGLDNDGRGRLPRTLKLVLDGSLVSALNAILLHPAMAGAKLTKAIDKALAKDKEVSALNYAKALFPAAKTGVEVAPGHVLGTLQIGSKLETIYSAMVPTSDQVFQCTGQEFNILFALAEEVFPVPDCT